MEIINTRKLIKKEEIQGDIPHFFKVVKDIMKVAWPSMVEGFLVALVTMFDGIMVSVLGNEANGAVNITKQPIYFMISIITALNIALTAIVSRRFGEKNKEACNNVLFTGIKISSVIAIFLSVIICILSRQICDWMGATESTINLASDYLFIISLGFIFNALRLTINACQRGVGKTKISMWTNIIANIINVVLNYLLIAGRHGFPAWGIQGAAIATVIGNAFAFFISLGAIFRRNGILRFNFNKFIFWDNESFKSILNIFPAAFIDQMCLRVGFILFALIVNYLGDDATYIHGICNDMNSLMFTLGDGFSIGVAAVIGHRLGEKRKDLALVYSKVSIILSICIASIVCLFMVFARGFIIDLYEPATAYRRDTAKLIMIIAACIMFPQNIQWLFTGILRVSGDTKYTARTSFVSVTIVRPIAAYLLTYTLGFGLIGAWVGMGFDQLARLLMNSSRFFKKKWLNIKV